MNSHVDSIPNGPTVAEIISRIDLAIAMLSSGMRPPLIARHLHLPGHMLRRLWEQVNGRPAPRGQFPPDSTRLLTAPGATTEAVAWWSVYYRLGSDAGVNVHRAIDLTLLLRAHRQYRLLFPPKPDRGLSLQGTYFIARDIVTHTVEVRYCKSCRIHYLYHLQASLVSCPFCG
ncbi:transcriptional activator FlhC [bacterium BMS3Bbin13]|nr:transcriptional activator FlhC [bacterium BMS3Bbin13]